MLFDRDGSEQNANILHNWIKVRCKSTARRPDNISEFEIPLYIAVRVIERYEPRFLSDENMNERVIEAASPIQSKIDEHLAQLSLSPDEIPGFIRAFYERVNEEMSSKAPPISRWEDLGDYCQINQ